MKRKRIILSIIFLLPVGWIYFLFNQTQQFFPSEKVNKAELSKEETFQSSKLITKKKIYAHYATNHLSSVVTSSNQPPKVVKRKDAISSFIDTLDPKDFEQYEGSYTLNQLKEKEGSKPFTLNSSWIIWNKNFPQLETSLRKNKETGEYEFIGGGIYFPTKGLGVNYERDKDTDETRAYLNLKKSF